MATESSSSGNKAWLRAAIALLVFIAIIALIVFLDPDNLYSWIKAFHIVAVIAWMAGMLYLPRLFIYHFDTRPGSESSELFKVMERRLLRIIMTPAMMLTWILGLTLVWKMLPPDGWLDWMRDNLWLLVKLSSVILLTGVHVYLSRAQRAFLDDERPLSQRRWRMINELPALLMIVIVLMVVLKPF
jgi:putative membrane protein